MAMSQFDDEKLEGQQKKQKLKKIVKIATPIFGCCIVFIIVLLTVIIPNSKYNAAIKLYNEGKYEEAMSVFGTLNGYKDSNEKYAELMTDKLKDADVGDIVKFGAYEQDNNTANGKEEIEWIVLAKEENRLLVISKYALDCRQYNTSNTIVTWETCTLRGWLNGTFMNSAFNTAEQKMIQSTTVTNEDNPSYGTSGGNNTTDKIFLLSISEVKNISNAVLICASTAYARANGAYTSDTYKTASGEAACWWWLRSPGYYQDTAAFVYIVGDVRCNGDRVIYDDCAVRPALWITIPS